MTVSVATLGMARRKIDDAGDAVDAIAQLVGRYPGGRELALAKTKLEEARHWLSAASEALRSA